MYWSCPDVDDGVSMCGSGARSLVMERTEGKCSVRTLRRAGASSTRPERMWIRVSVRHCVLGQLSF